MRVLASSCRAATARLLLCAAAGAFSPLAGAAGALEPKSSPPQPLIEVVAFGVAPVAGVEEDAALKPKPGDIVHREAPAAPRQDVPAGIETRVAAAESWPQLLSRLELPVPDAARAQLNLLPRLVPGKYLRGR